MKFASGELLYSPSDLVGFLESPFSSWMAVFVNGELEYVTGRALPPDISRSGGRELIAEINDLTRHHQIRVITMQRLTVQQRRSRAVTQVYKRIQRRAIRSDLTVFIESLNRKETRTKETLASLYPELRRYLGNAAWERRYYKHIFKAVSAGVEWLRINENERISNEG